MNVQEVKKKVKDKRIQKIIEKIDKKQVSDDEWILFAKERSAYVGTDIEKDVKRLFYPLGYLEMATIMIDGIVRWRNSICVKCRRQEGYDKHSCTIYQKKEKEGRGIPNKIWANENAECPYFESL